VGAGAERRVPKVVELLGLTMRGASQITPALARAASVAGHPFVLIPLAVAAVSTQSMPWNRALAIGGLVFACTAMPLLVVIRRKVVAGQWTDHDVSDAVERRSFYPLAAAILAVSALVFWLLGVPERIVAGTGLALVALFLAMVVNRFSKISLHMIFGAYSAVILFAVSAWLGALALALVGVVGWSRIVLERHTALEIAAGAMLGGATGALLLALT
jgi:membrane-associated phospholipid phosphatase